MTRYVIQRLDDQMYWIGKNVWINDERYASLFDSSLAAYAKGLAECPADSSLWKVEPVPDQGQAEPVSQGEQV